MKNIFKNPSKDALKIQETIDYRVLKAAWDSYARINKGDFKAKFKTSTPAWYALFAVQNYKGKFKDFSVEELHLLKSLTSVQSAYSDIIKALEDNASDEDLSEYILRTHPNLEQAVPKEFLYVDKIGGYIAKEIQTYQSLLLNFYTTYQPSIDDAIQKIEQSK
jgi:hypothetical protein